MVFMVGNELDDRKTNIWIDIKLIFLSLCLAFLTIYENIRRNGTRPKASKLSILDKRKNILRKMKSISVLSFEKPTLDLKGQGHVTVKKPFIFMIYIVAQTWPICSAQILVGGVNPQPSYF